MTTIANRTPRAIAVPLPRGKKLHLGPGKTGHIAANDSEHPPFKKLVEAGEIEIVDDGREAIAASAGGRTARHFMPGHGSSPVGRRGGDR
jgi:hypothetical protein